MFNKQPGSNKITRRNSEKVTDPKSIARLLEQLSRRYTPLTVQIPGHKPLFTSCSVGIEDDYLLLDQLMPANGHRLLLETGKLKVTGKLDGIDIGFNTTLERVDDQENVLTYYMNLPELLTYRQRRSAYRVNIPMSKQLRVMIDDEFDAIAEEALIEGVQHDLSHGGVGMIFANTAITVESGVLKECAIELPDDVWLYCTVELRYSKKFHTRDQQHIGARFIGLRPAQTRLIGRFISELERELLKKRAY